MYMPIFRYLCPKRCSGFLLGSLFRDNLHHHLKRCLQIGQPSRSVSLSLINYKQRKKLDSEEPKKRKVHKTTVFDVVDVWRNMSVKDLAKAVNKDLEHVQEAMLYVKGADNIEPSTRLEDLKIIKEIVNKCGMRTKTIAPPSDVQVELRDRDITPRPPAPEHLLKPRPPVVTVMGHVDHGKTTLLDTLRGASVAAGEAGGITQHIGAFTVPLENGEAVTFLDTPGHAAFSAMRSRGAHCTDIIVLVVAADDGVMEQTREVIQLANETKVPIIVAINKIDKQNADVERTKKGLLQIGIALEGHGGDVQFVEISALQGTNLNELADAIVTQAALMGLKSEYTGLVEGVVVESRLDTKRGKLSTAIVTRGTLRKGCILVSGEAHGKVRALIDHSGQLVDVVEPGQPVEILGWRELPLAGDLILEVETEKKAHSVLHFRHQASLKVRAEHNVEAIQQKELAHLEEYRKKREERRKSGYFKLRQIVRPKESGPIDPTPRVNLIIKGDVHGSVEAILDVLDTYHSEQCRVDIIHYGVGEITAGDMDLAKTFNAIIYAFSIKVPPKPPKDIVIREFDIIYRLVDDLKEEINKKLPDIEVEEQLGVANVVQIFKIDEGKKEVTVVGCRCTKGVLKKSAFFRLMRQDELLSDGPVESMRHLKNEVDSVKKDVECGIRLKDQAVEIRPGDELICYTKKPEPQVTDWNPGF